MGSRISCRALMAGLTSLCAAVLFIVAPLSQRASAAADPQDVVRGFYGVLLSNMKQGRILGESARLARLAPVVDRTFDIPAMTRLAVGPTWGTLNLAQQQLIRVSSCRSPGNGRTGQV